MMVWIAIRLKGWSIDSKIVLKVCSMKCCKWRHNWQIWTIITNLSLILLTKMINYYCNSNLEFCSISWWNIHSIISKIALNNLHGTYTMHYWDVFTWKLMKGWNLKSMQKSLHFDFQLMEKIRLCLPKGMKE